MTEYPITATYKILGQILAAALIVCGILIINSAFHLDHPRGEGPLLVMGMVIASLGSWLMIGATRLCLTVDDDAFRVRGALGTRELPMSEIDGYRYGDKNRFYLVRKNGKQFVISDYIAQRDELIDWIKSRYGDVDARERAAETKVVLQDERYGATAEDRKAALQKARNIAWTLNPVSVGISFLVLFMQNVGSGLVEPMIYLLYALPWIAIFLTWRSNALIRLSIRKGTPHPSLAYMMGAPAFMLGVYAVARYRFYGFPGHAWQVTGLTALVVILLALTTLRGTIALEKQKVLTIVLLIVFGSFYSFGVATTSNCLLDRNTPETLEAQVLWKHVHHGKSTTYNLQLSPWGRYTQGNTIAVSRDFFNFIRRNDSVRILLYPGKWGIPWYRVPAYNVH